MGDLLTDKGSEIGEMIRIHAILRAQAAPEYTEEQWPSSIQVQSKHNTPIEGFWLWVRKGEGHNLRNVLEEGRDRGIFNGSDDLHVCVFNWIWPPLVQHRLDGFCEYWNHHRIRKQQNKTLPAGTSPNQLWISPESAVATAKNCSIRVDMELVKALREELGGEEGRDEALQFVTREFEEEAQTAYTNLQTPAVDLTNVWHIFTLLVAEIQQLRTET
ncbi:hypothetical protein EUX98_g8732 [Antrodiella citrinella]|uniref:Integrase core domain-containing protein n=1 Tax=Antrodiella citrinella TaxID=2447956 RepID=A0A4S4M592_9APHY|nr:hypothetical protein EUX98_g8732 [Antrodiella citrinella]